MKLISGIKAVASITASEAQRFLEVRRGETSKRAHPLTAITWKLTQNYYANLAPTIYSQREQGYDIEHLNRKYGEEAVEFALYDNDPLFDND